MSFNDTIDLGLGYRELLDSLNIGFMLIDMDFHYLDVNKTYLKMTGLKHSDVVGHHALEFYNQKEFEQLKDIVLPLRGHDDYHFEFVLPTVNGERIPVVHNSHINRDMEGRPISIYVTTTDIRDQKKVLQELESAYEALNVSFETLEKEKKKLESILIGIDDCVSLYDANGKWLLCNPKGMSLRGQRKAPFLPLKSKTEKQVRITIDSEEHQFLGHVQGIRDQQGILYAYVEILKDITFQVKLAEREHELSNIKRQIGRKKLHTEIIGISSAMQRVFELILRCAEVDSTILIQGETGVGKELAARAIHAHSARKENPFVAVNCGALPETLLESELFGHVKGSFTGALSDRAGLFQTARGGTLFLDEIGDLNRSLQVKLLHVLQDKRVRPVGSDRMHQVDVRIMAATNKDLDRLVEDGLFRSDLYYRLAVIPLIIPPLRDRREDIIPLANHFIKKFQKNSKWSPLAFDHETQQLLLDHSWAGNVRELENAIEHCVAMARGPLLTPDSMPVQILGTSHSTLKRIQDGKPRAATNDKTTNLEPFLGNLPQKLHQKEKEAISDALLRFNGKRSLVAGELGISRATLWRKMKKHQLV